MQQTGGRQAETIFLFGRGTNIVSFGDAECYSALQRLGIRVDLQDDLPDSGLLAENPPDVFHLGGNA